MTPAKLTSASIDDGRRPRAGARFLCLLAALIALAGCSRRAPLGSPVPAGVDATTLPAASAGPATEFGSDAWGIRIELPPGWQVRRDFRSGYLANGTWKAFAAPGSEGSAVVALIVPGSDRITDAELRIGASRGTAEVQRCSEPPANARPGSTGHARIAGVAFTTFDAADAAMSHHLEVHALRTVRNGACYAIDLLVFGVDPAVYDPPAKPPFSDAQAFASMRRVLQTLRFAPRDGQGAASASTTSR